jgi:thymidylate synthase
MFQQLHDLWIDILANGERFENDRTGVGRISIFAPEKRLAFDLREGFPLYEGRRLNGALFCAEIVGFLRGYDNVKQFQELGINYWDSWADKDGYLGRIYPKQWTGWRMPFGGKINQIQKLVQGLISDPFGARHVVSAWNVSDIADLETPQLPPCHFAFQCHVNNARELSLNVFLRSSDTPVGLPANIANYAFLLHVLARATGYKATMLYVTITGNAHIYFDQVEGVQKLLQRAHTVTDAKLVFKTENIDPFGYQFDPKDEAKCDFIIEGYKPLKGIKFPVAV